MTGGRFLSGAFLVCLVLSGCRTVQTPVPVHEIQEAKAAAETAVSGAVVLVGKAESLSGDLEGLPVPDAVKEKARDLVLAAKNVQSETVAVVKKVNSVAPAVEIIAGERDQAIAGEREAIAKASASRVLSMKLLAVMILMMIAAGVVITLRFRKIITMLIPP